MKDKDFDIDTIGVSTWRLGGHHWPDPVFLYQPRQLTQLSSLCFPLHSFTISLQSGGGGIGLHPHLLTSDLVTPLNSSYIIKQLHVHLDALFVQGGELVDLMTFNKVKNKVGVVNVHY